MGRVVHFEIPADDEDRAREFYRSNFGWSFQVIPELEYSLATTGNVSPEGMPTDAFSINGAIFRRGDVVKFPLITIAVDNIDAALEHIVQSGGKTVRGKLEVPGLGWNAYFQDTEGNIIGLWQDTSPAAS
jgi:predicted enzyme related to lactoylglutathione lyase